MTTVPFEPPAGSPAARPERPVDAGIFKRPRATEGWVSWLTTIDHKRVGTLYGVTAFIFFLIGGVEALLLRLQLAQPNGKILDANAYNELFTMHGTTMVFLVIMPMSAAFANYLIPIQIGAADVAFPRLNAFSYWTFLGGGLFLYSSFFLGGMPNGGWFGYAPNTSIVYSPGHNIDFWVIGLLITGIASTAGAANLIVTCLNMRAPGMTLMKMPVFTWMSLIAQFLTLFAMPVITVALVLLMFDRNFGSHFFDPAAGGDPVLWQHLFWLFGHPEVYILILPAFGIVSEIIPVFARKPLFGYPVMVISGIAIGFMGWGVWVHHMFAVGLGPVAVSAFSVSTMLIAVPTGVKIFNWIGTMWKGSLRFTTPMLFAVGLVSQFTIGGLSGVTHGVASHDRQQTDTYYVVAHFHYVLFGGAIFALFAAIYYWYPKVFGQMLDDRLGRRHFWLFIVGFNLTFFPHHILGLIGMPRRIYTYPEGMGWAALNLASTIGAFVIAFGTLVFMRNVYVTRKKFKQFDLTVEADPWDGRTLEWSIPSPAPAYNFAETPVVRYQDDWWHRKYTEDGEGRLLARPEIDEVRARANDGLKPGQHPHIPSPSFYPIVAAFWLPVSGYGLVYGRASGWNYVVTGLGLTLFVVTLIAWALEPPTQPPEPHDEPDRPHDPLPALASSNGGNRRGLAPAGGDGSDGADSPGEQQSLPAREDEPVPVSMSAGGGSPGTPPPGQEHSVPVSASAAGSTVGSTSGASTPDAGGGK